MAGFRIEGNTSGNVAEVTSGNEIKVALTNTPANIGGVRTFSENDPGKATGTPYLASPEVDDDFRLRVSNDIIFDDETFSYTAQNFTKHAMYTTTFVPSWTLAGYNTNPTSITTAAAATVLKTYKTFSIQGTETLALDIELALAAAVGTNTVLEVGFGLTANTTPYDCFDGVYFRFTAAGAFGVIRYNSATDSSATGNGTVPFNDYTGGVWAPVPARKYQAIIYVTTRAVEFWINDPITEQIWLAGDLPTPPGFGAPTASSSLPMFLRQYYSAAASTSTGLIIGRYNVRRGGTNISTTFNVHSARAFESIYSPGTLTTTQAQAITTTGITRPAAAVPSVSASTLTSLGGIYVETGTLAIGTDAILMSYQVPALPTAVAATFTPNKRLRIDGVIIASGVTTAFATGGFQKHFYIAYGGTALTLISTGASADAASGTKAHRRVHLPIVQYYTATHAPGAPNGASTSYAFQTPIYVNPGEFIILATYHQGTVGTTGVITHALQFDYSWE